MGDGLHIVELKYEIYLEGELLDNESFQLIGLSVTDRLNRVPRARLEINYFSVSDKKKEKVNLQSSDKLKKEPQKKSTAFLPGAEIQVKLGHDNESTEVFSGLITKQSIEANGRSSFVITVDCKHKVNSMTLGKRTRFLHEGLSGKSSGKENGVDQVEDIDALKKILEFYDMSLDSPSQLKNEFGHENLVQYNCSDWDFLIIRAEQLGLVCQVINDQIKLIDPVVGERVKDPVVLGETLISYEAEHDASKISSAFGVTKGEFEDDTKAVGEYTSNNGAEESESSVQSDAILNHGGDLEVGEMKAWMDNKSKRQELSKVLGTARIMGTTDYEIGDTVSIEGFDSIWSEESLISGLKHTVKNGVWHTYLQCGMSACSHADEFDLNANESSSLFPGASGLLFGRVAGYRTGRDDNELVEVTIPSASEFENNEPTEAKKIVARMTSPFANETRGFVFRPMVGDEVVVGFINNDPRFPIVLGSLYNKTNQPGFSLDDNEQKEMGIKVGDWKISIHEEDNILTISSPKDQKIILEDDKEITMAFDDNNMISISKDLVEIKAKDIKISAQTDLVMEATEIGITANSKLVMEGGQYELKGTATGKLEAPIIEVN
ncbi:MAG: phage baseplate assembly protein V [Crocinitomicaceae bacterium]|nr:phage baseplate assembly protein V [Crocinitomicaceae bacterium]